MSLEARIRISAFVDQAVKGLRALQKEAVAVQDATAPRTSRAFENVAAGAATAGAKTKAAKKEVDDLQAAAVSKTGASKPFDETASGAARLADRISGLQTRVTQFFAAIAGIQLGRNVLALIDAYNGLTARLKVTTGGQVLYNQALEAAQDLSARYQAGLTDTARLIDRVYASISPLGGSLRNATTAAEALLAALKIGGATVDETSSAILQFSQSLGKGVLNGDEFNAVNEAAPGLLRALGAALGKSTGDLKKMGEQGTLTSDVIIKAATIALPKLRAQAEAIGPTIGGSFTGLNNALTEFIGKGAQASGTARTIAGALKLIAQNIDLVVAALSILAGAALLSGLVRVGAAVATFVAGLGAAGIGIRALVSLVGGPVGLIVTLVSLAAAWFGVEKAQRAAAAGSLESLKADRARVQELVATLQAKGDTGATAGRAAALERNLKRLAELEAEIAKLEAKPAAAAAEVDIRAEGPLKAKLEENKGKRRLDEDYARDRELIETQSAKKIASLRAAGRNAEADNLAVDARESLTRLKKSHDDAVRALTKEETTTRIAQYVAAYDRIAELVSDGTARELKALQAGYEQQLVSTKDYFRQRGQLEDEAKREATGKIESESAARQAVLAKNRRIRPSNANEASALAEANTREEEAIKKLEVDRVKAQRDLVDGARERGLEEARATDQLRRQREETDLQIKSLNEQLTLADERQRLELQYADARKRERLETGATTRTDELIAVQLRIAELKRLEQQYSSLAETVKLKEADIDAQVEQGRLTAVEAEQQKFAARARSIPQLEAILARLQELATTPTEKNAVEGARQALQALKSTYTELDRTIRSSATSSLTQFFNDTQFGAKSTKDALLDMVSSFTKAMLNVLNQRLAEKLVKQFEDSVGTGGGGFLGFLAGLFGAGSGSGAAPGYTGAVNFHSGGVVGAGGVQRRVPTAAFAFAPRYHSGGIAGLRPNEVPAILEEGERVFTKRQARSISGSVGDINIGVTVNGADGSNDDRRAFGDELAQRIRGVTLDVIGEQKRQGGLLAAR